MANNNSSHNSSNRGRDDRANDAGDEEEEIEMRGGPSVGDALKKLFTAGVSAAFMTEESIRTLVSEVKLPKETLNMVLQGASKSKEQLMDRVGREIVGIISKIDFVKEASRFVEEHKFKITAEIEVTRKDSASAGDKPSVQSNFAVQADPKPKA